MEPAFSPPISIKTIWRGAAVKAFSYLVILMAITTNALAMGGKKQDEPALPKGLTNALGANVAATPVVDPVLAFANWCQSRLGRLTPDQSQCVTQLSYRFGKKLRSDVWNSEVKVAPNDSVDVVSTGSPKILVGLNEGPAKAIESEKFVPGVDGILAFSAPGKGKKFSVSQVSVRRCFEASGKAALCNENETTAEENLRSRSFDGKRRKRPASANMSRVAS
jgi:hypothetical protein